MAGGLLLERARLGEGAILPVDSEPSALWQCLQGESREDVRHLILTASGGALQTVYPGLPGDSPRAPGRRTSKVDPSPARESTEISPS